MRSKIAFAMAMTPLLLTATVPYERTYPPQRNAQEPVCYSPFHRAHFEVRHTESKGVGYKDGYSTLEWFGIVNGNCRFMPFLDLRGHVFNDGKLAGNVGIGERSVMPSINHIFGLYLYYDVRQEEHGLMVNQLSPGLELVGRRMEYRINAYFPVGRDESHSYQHSFYDFDGNQMLLQYKRRYAMKGGDAEMGVHLTQSTRHDLYAGVGPYYFTADPDSFWGGKGRLYWRYKEYISLEASYSYDHIFKNIVQGTVALGYPLGKKLKRKGKNCPNKNDLALSRAAFAPYRFEIPVVEVKKHRHIALDPVTQEPITVWFVDNTSHSAGTYESPFSTLAQAQNAAGPNDMIYVFPGDGTTTGMNAGITLQNGQKLFGSGTIQYVSTTKGVIAIPPFSSKAPSITTAVGSVVTLASGNEVSGFNMINKVSGAVTVSGASGTIGATVSNNDIVGDQSLGIQVTGSGNVNIVNNQIHITPPPGGGAGIMVTSDQGTSMNAMISNNLVEGISGGFLNGTAIDVYQCNGTFFIKNNVINMAVNGFEGIRITPYRGANFTTVIANNIITGPMISYGIGINGNTNATLDITMINNTITNIGIAAIYFGSNNTTARVANNFINGAGHPGISLQGISNSCIAIENNQMVNVSHGVELFGPTGTNTVNAINNQIQPRVGGIGFSLANAAPATLCLSLTDNVVTGTATGFTLNNPVGGRFNAFIAESNVGSITTSGIVNVISDSCPPCVP
jgi:hypothetical protein